MYQSSQGGRYDERVFINMNQNKNTKHGLYKTKLYKEWLRIKRACNMPSQSSYKYVGGRGIKLFDEWNKDFTAFAEWVNAHGYEEGEVIERLDTEKDFEPDNLVFVTQENRYQYKSNVRMLEYQGEKHSLSEWARLLGLTKQTLSARLQRGHPFPDAIKHEYELYKQK